MKTLLGLVVVASAGFALLFAQRTREAEYRRGFAEGQRASGHSYSITLENDQGTWSYSGSTNSTFIPARGTNGFLVTVSAD